MAFHELKRFRFEKRAVLDRINTGLDRFLRGLVAMAMDGDLLAETMRFIDQRRHFRGRELRCVDLVGH